MFRNNVFYPKKVNNGTWYLYKYVAVRGVQGARKLARVVQGAKRGQEWSIGQDGRRAGMVGCKKGAKRVPGEKKGRKWCRF